MELCCEVCGTNFKYHRKLKFCSRKCFYSSRKNKIERTCVLCGKKFKVVPSRVKYGRGKYCSMGCRIKAKKQQKVTINCLYCGVEFQVIKVRFENSNPKYCSKECYMNTITKVNNDIKKEICVLYLKGQSTKKIGEKYNISSIHVWELLKNEGIKMEYNRYGENNPAWKGGKSFEPYCSHFTEEFKERVREFWGRKCGRCGKLEKINLRKYNERLAVHHINYDKETCCNDTAPLFIPLCKECHTKTNHNRLYWEELLSNYIMIYNNGKCYLTKEEVKR